MKQRCQEVANALLGLNNMLVKGETVVNVAGQMGLDLALHRAVWIAQDVASVASLLQTRGILTGEEAKPFRSIAVGLAENTEHKKADVGMVESAQVALSMLGGTAEKLMWAKVLQCECAGRSLYQVLKEGEEHELPARYPGRGVM